MISLEQQVVSLELAKRLKELGVKQESLFWWVEMPADKEFYIQPGDTAQLFSPRYSAFTVAELREILPRRYGTQRYQEGWYCSNRGDGDAAYVDEGANTAADTRAKVLIYLVEYKLVTL
jgi:hypothetical protein